MLRDICLESSADKVLLLNLGLLSCLDGYMNIALEQTEEYVKGRMTNRYGDAFVRGNNGAFLACCYFSCPNMTLVLYISAAEAL